MKCQVQVEVQILAYAHPQKTNKLLNFIRLVEEFAIWLLFQDSSIPMLINRKPVQKGGIGEKCSFSPLLWRWPLKPLKQHLTQQMVGEY